ncbi:LEA type 2 family protein [Vulgatibacter incomptus]|uniref:Water stress and hypersensitive response domain-containing protein n=1 Tax=Vulgatibacter incomptus TaxID=1391653 RepID=A0A0K1PH98_9BACT|nr:LEA type 2 family protein [Vulgatibacter incomptus]AKU92913.1 hypothetical protein AKJ08_3300 [Vulgatibacter incomptus]
MRRSRTWILLLLCATFLNSSGCSLLQMIAGNKKPDLTFKEVRFAGWSLDQVQLDLVYELDNPYDVPLNLAKVAYQLEVEGRRILSGSPNQGLKIQPRKKQTLVFPAQVHFLDVIPTVTALFTKSSLGYRASGSLGVDSPLGVISLPISKSGLIEVPKLPSLDLAGISVPQKSASGATVALALDVTNHNAFPLPVTGLDYALQLGGSKVGGGKAQGALVNPGERRRIEIPVGVSLAGASSAVLSLISGKPADVGVTGQLGLGKIATPIDLKKRLTAR